MLMVRLKWHGTRIWRSIKSRVCTYIYRNVQHSWKHSCLYNYQHIFLLFRVYFWIILTSIWILNDEFIKVIKVCNLLRIIDAGLFLDVYIGKLAPHNFIHCRYEKKYIEKYRRLKSRIFPYRKIKRAFGWYFTSRN